MSNDKVEATFHGGEACPATIAVENMANLLLDCRLTRFHTGLHVDSTTGTRWDYS